MHLASLTGIGAWDGACVIRNCQTFGPTMAHAELRARGPGVAEKADSTRADWAHVYLSVLPTLPLCAPGDEPRVTASLRAACAKARLRSASAILTSCLHAVQPAVSSPLFS